MQSTVAYCLFKPKALQASILAIFPTAYMKAVAAEHQWLINPPSLNLVNSVWKCIVHFPKAFKYVEVSKVSLVSDTELALMFPVLISSKMGTFLLLNSGHH